MRGGCGARQFFGVSPQPPTIVYSPADHSMFAPEVKIASKTPSRAANLEPLPRFNPLIAGPCGATAPLSPRAALRRGTWKLECASWHQARLRLVFRSQSLALSVVSTHPVIFRVRRLPLVCNVTKKGSLIFKIYLGGSLPNKSCGGDNFQLTGVNGRELAL